MGLRHILWLSAALAAIALVLLLLTRTDPAPSEAARPEAPARAERAAGLQHELDAPDDVAGDARDREPLAGEVPAPAVDALWRSALGGVRGRLIEEDGSPIAGMSVRLFDAQPEGMIGALDPSFDALAGLLGTRAAITRTASDGTFALSGLRPGGMLFLGVDLGGARSALRLIGTAVERGAEADLGDIALAPMVALRGRLLDDAGTPIAGARLRAVPGTDVGLEFSSAILWPEVMLFFSRESGIELDPALHGLMRHLPGPGARTAADGRFELAVPRVPSVRLGIDGAGLPPTISDVIELGPAGAGSDLELRVGRGIAIHGVAVDELGQPVRGAEIRAGIKRSGFISASALFPCVRSDENGRFQTARLPLGDELMVAARRGPGQAWSTVDLELAEAVGKELRVELPSTRTVIVYAREESGAPVAFADIRLVAGDDWFAPLVGMLRQEAALFSRLGDAPGFYTLEGVAPGSYQVLGRLEDGRAARAELEFAGTEEPPRVELEFPGARLAVEVYDAITGAPIPGATAVVLGEAGEDAATSTARSGADGRAGAWRWSEKEALLRIEHPAFAPLVLRVQPGEATAIAALDRGATVLGTLRVRGEPPGRPLWIEMMAEDKAVERSIAGFSFYVPCDAEGRFRADRVPRGRWRFTTDAHSNAGLLFDLGDERDVCVGVPGMQALDIHAIGTVSVTISLPE